MGISGAMFGGKLCTKSMPLANALHNIELVPPIGETGCRKQIAGLRVIPVVVSVIALVTVRESAEYQHKQGNQ